MSPRRLPYGRQHIDENDIEAVCKVLKSDFITQGPVVEQFEQALADYCGAGHAVAVNSATSALHIACLALDVGKSDCVWTTPNTFVASANCARYCQASVDFVDIDPQTYNMCPAALASKLENARNQGLTLPKVVIVVHFAGQSCEMDIFAKLAKEYHFQLIEDASHAVGASYKSRRVGSCQYSDIVIFSFHPVKIITSGEGGMALTNNDTLAKRLRLFRSHGVIRPEVGSSRVSDEPWLYHQIDLGFNYRMTEVHAALGLSQLRRIDEFIDRRRSLAARYNEELNTLPLVQPFQGEYGNSALHLYPVLMPKDSDAKDTRLALYQYFHQHGVGVNVHYIPVHTQPYYYTLGFREGDYPVAENYYQRTLSLPIFGSMSDCEQDTVIELLHTFYGTVKVRSAA